LFLSVSRSTASSALRSNPLYLCLRSNANPSTPVLTSLSFSLLHNDPSCRKTSTTNRTFLVWLWNKRIQQKTLKASVRASSISFLLSPTLNPERINRCCKRNSKDKKI
jgi:hypothetical protein